MASLSIRCGVNRPFIHNQSLRFGIDRSNFTSPPNQIAQIPRSLSISNQIDSIKTKPHQISSNWKSNNKIVNKEYKEALSSEKLDEWMRDSVMEIVKNLREAPLLVQVYENNNGETRLETEEAIAENWPVVTRKWKDGETSSPDALILVEELEDEKDFNGDGEENSARAWGIVIQGKGVECGSACYLLKTSRVGSGLGRFCTHFCLVRVTSFRESALSQLTDCWLLQ